MTDTGHGGRTGEQPQYLVEVAHAYLESLAETTEPSFAVEPVERTLSVLDTHGLPFSVVVVVDDTSAAFEGRFGTDAFERFRTELAEQYVERLPIPVDEYVFESEFGPAVRRLLSQCPTVDAGELGEPNAWGLLHTDDDRTAYLYGEHAVGESKPKAKVIDRTPESAKVTPYTCAAYDAAITLTKRGVFDPIDCLPQATHTITCYDDEFVGSWPYRDSHLIQRVVANHDIIPAVTSVDANHLEVTPSHDAARVADFLPAAVAE